MAEMHDRQVSLIERKILRLKSSLKFYERELDFWINHPERERNNE